MSTRKELIDAVGARYRLVSKAERSTILDEFEAITGYHRKHCIRLLSKPPAPPRERRLSVQYGPAVRNALGALWEVSDRVCSKRLKVMVPALLPAMIRHGRISNDPNLHAQLLAVSPATIDRLLAALRLAASKGRRRAAGQSSAVRRAVPVRTFGDWGDPAPGYLEVDFVAHCGPQLAGNFIQTLVLTDVATGWTECVPVLIPEVKASLEHVLATVDPVVLLDEIRAAQDDLGRRVDQRGVDGPNAHTVDAVKDLAAVTRSVLSAEQRAIHRRPYRRRKPIPRKARMLDAYEDDARGWLQRQPGMTAVEILRLLRERAPEGTFTDKHLRTVQRALAAWRADAIRQWIDQCRLETDARGSTATEIAAL